MSEAFVGEIRLVAFPHVLPNGWLLCDGTVYPIVGNEDLHNVLQNAYGGDGTTTFAVPDLRGRAPIHRSDEIVLGTQGGEEAVTLTTEHLPAHRHGLLASVSPASSTDPRENVPALGGSYASAPDGTIMSDASLRVNGSDQPHDNMQPSLVMRYIICKNGFVPH